MGLQSSGARKMRFSENRPLKIYFILLPEVPPLKTLFVETKYNFCWVFSLNFRAIVAFDRPLLSGQPRLGGVRVTTRPRHGRLPYRTRTVTIIKRITRYQRFRRSIRSTDGNRCRKSVRFHRRFPHTVRHHSRGSLGRFTRTRPRPHRGLQFRRCHVRWSRVARTFVHTLITMLIT